MQQVVQTVLMRGADGIIIDVECAITNGLPSMVIVGLGNKAIDEAKERLRSAFTKSNLPFPKKRITINLAPADIPKDSSNFDVAIAISILKTAGYIKHLSQHSSQAYFGEVGLDGQIRAVRGIIGKIIAAQKHGLTTFYIPKNNMQQAALIQGISLVGVSTLNELVTALRENNTQKPTISTDETKPPRNRRDPFADIAGQQQAKRALIIAAAGGHNVLLSGPPGTGKSLLARSLPLLMPQPSHNEILEITHLHSLTNTNYEQLITERPFRAPHHTASMTAIVGGGQHLKPGEISLSHRGVLLLDEIPEFGRKTLESLRQPLEDRVIVLSRARETIAYPANFILIATANPCPCGYYGTERSCYCSLRQIISYQQKVSGPILDRIDIHVAVDAVVHTQLLHQNAAPSSQPAALVVQARAAQYSRVQSQLLNGDLDNTGVRKYAALTKAAETMLNTAAKSLGLSARAYMRTVKVARTIADIEGNSNTDTAHIAEALRYRQQQFGHIIRSQT